MKEIIEISSHMIGFSAEMYLKKDTGNVESGVCV